MYKKIIGLAVLPFLLAGCADNINSDHYNTNQAGKVSTVSQCTVLSVRQVGVNSDSGAGTLIGRHCRRRSRFYHRRRQHRTYAGSGWRRIAWRSCW